MCRKGIISASLATATTLVALSAAFPAAAAEPTSKWCEGVKIAAFTGGWKPAFGDDFSDTIQNGFAQAAADLGATMTYYYSQWDPDFMTNDFEKAIATKVDGIAFVGHAGDAKVDGLIDRAFAQGTIVTVLDVALPDAQKKYTSQGMGYVGQRGHAAGFALATEAAKRSGLKSGDKVVVWGSRFFGGEAAQRPTGVVDGFEKLGAKVVYQEIDPAAYQGGGNQMQDFFNLAAANPDAKIIIAEGDGLTSRVAGFAAAANLKPGQMFLAGFELSAGAVEGIKNGYLNLVLDEQEFLQGYVPILNICLTKKFGFSGLDVDTTGVFVDASNVDAVAALVVKRIR